MGALSKWTLNEAARAMNASFNGDDAVFNAVSTDTRTLKEGSLFIALKGPRFDAHEHLLQAKDKGAVAAVVSESCDAVLPLLKVQDTRIALGQLAKAHRQSFKKPVIGLTGSNGKTTVKELLTAVLSTQGRVLATKGNLNNDFGVPLTLLEMKLDEDFAVIEMGANHPKEIEYLAQIALPDVAIVNNAGEAHLEGFGSLKGVATSKGEIFESLSADGVAIINRDDQFAPLWLEMTKHCRQIGFGIRSVEADVRASAIEQNAQGSRFTLQTEKGEFEIQLGLYGQHNVMNALAAAAAALAVGVSEKDIQKGLQDFRAVKGRLHSMHGQAGSLIFDDSYNANPSSLKAGIDVLSGFGGKRILALGDMLELGANAAQDHYQCGVYAREKGIDQMFAYGPLSKNAVDAFGENGFWFEDKQSLIAQLQKELSDQTTVLVKGSRGMRMEDVVRAVTIEMQTVAGEAH